MRVMNRLDRRALKWIAIWHRNREQGQERRRPESCHDLGYFTENDVNEKPHIVARPPLLARVLGGISLMTLWVAVSACSFSGSSGETDANAGVATWPTGHRFRKAITVNARADVLPGFVIAIFANADDNLIGQSGDDFVLQTDAGDDVPFELESFNADTGAFVLWATLAQLKAEQVLYLYYDHEKDTKTSAPENIWPAQARAVWHGTVAGTTVVDSTANQLDATANPPQRAPAMAPGIVGQALDLRAASPRLTLDKKDLNKIRFDTKSFSYSVWVKVTSPEKGDEQAWQFGGTGAQISGYMLELGTGKWRAQVADGTNDYVERFSDSNFSDSKFKGQWTQLVVIIDQSDTSSPTFNVYANGAFVQSQSLGSKAVDLSPKPGTQAYIGGDSTHPFIGLIDELRITEGALSAAEISAQYDNLTNTDSSFFTIGNQEAPAN